jgi:hypothetical protein
MSSALPATRNDDDAAQREYGDFGRAAADVDDHRSGRLVDREPGADSGRHRFGDDVDAPRTGGVGRLGHRALLDAGDRRRHADHHARTRERPASSQHLAHEVPQHLRGDLVVGDHAVAQGTDGLDVVGGAADHALGLGADRNDGVGGRVDRDDRRLVEQDAAPPRIDQGVRRPEVDREIAAQQVPAALRPQRPAGERSQTHVWVPSWRRAAIAWPSSGRDRPVPDLKVVSW